MRVVGGQWRGRALASPRSDAVRPTSDRTREAIFNVLAHRHARRIEGARVLDLFAGTGALGIEALSRGAAFCLFVDASAEGRALLRANIETFAIAGRSKLFRRDATRLGGIGNMSPFDLVFADPPYGKGLGEQALRSLREGGWLAEGALCVIEETAAVPFGLGEGYVLADQRDYGETVIRFVQNA